MLGYGNLSLKSDPISKFVFFKQIMYKHHLLVQNFFLIKYCFVSSRNVIDKLMELCSFQIWMKEDAVNWVCLKPHQWSLEITLALKAFIVCIRLLLVTKGGASATDRGYVCS